MLSHLLLHPEGENSELGSLRAEEYIFRVLVGQDLLMDKVSGEEKTKRAQVINKTVGHIPGAENALHIYQTWNKNANTAMRCEHDGQLHTIRSSGLPSSQKLVVRQQV